MKDNDAPLKIYFISVNFRINNVRFKVVKLNKTKNLIKHFNKTLISFAMDVFTTCFILLIKVYANFLGIRAISIINVIDNII